MADEEDEIKKKPPVPSDGAPDSSDNDPDLDDLNDPTATNGDMEDDIEPEEQDELFMNRNSALSAGPGKAIAFGFIMMLVTVFILYSLFGNKPKPVNPNTIEAVGGLPDLGAMPSVPAPPPPGGPLSDVTPEPPPPPAPAAAAPAPPIPPALSAPVNTSRPTGAPVPNAPPAPPLPSVPAPGANRPSTTPPPPPPPLPPLPAPRKSGSAPPSPNAKALSPISANTDKKEQERIRSNMLVMNGGADEEQTDEKKLADGTLNKSDANRAFTANALLASKADKTNATRVNNLGLTIIQGKIIDAVLESAINTDLPGTIRAIVSRDVFAESGRDIMIPKGSRLIGLYNTGVTRGQVRVLVVWTRVIRPDGIDIDIGSNAIDQLGRAGVLGSVDNKYSEIFSAAILTSVLDIGLAVALDAVSNQSSSTTTNANGTTSVGSAAAPAGAAAISSIGNVSKDVVNTLLDLRPTITVDQGTKMLIFVNKDLTFPGTQKSLVQ